MREILILDEDNFNALTYVRSLKDLTKEIVHVIARKRILSVIAVHSIILLFQSIPAFLFKNLSFNNS